MTNPMREEMEKCGVCGVPRCKNNDGINCYAKHEEEDWRNPKVICHGKCHAAKVGEAADELQKSV